MSQEIPTTIQLVDENGTFDETHLDSFVKTAKLSECGLSYAVVSIMGPQSSGKSTLLNNLFGTNFTEMDALQGRNQTTKGMWLSIAKGIHPQTIIMDLEGTDGRERGEDETAFEKQSALFALAVSDIVLINMWCHDIGREQAANKPLLRTVFQVMMRLFTPRKSTLLFVVRDKTKTPFDILEGILRGDVQKIWDSVPKPSKHKTTPISEFFNVEVTALASYEQKEDEFLQQVSNLRQRFENSIAPGGLAGDRRTVIPGSGFPFSMQEIWRVIKENKDLDLPAHKIMVATVRCEEIAKEKLSELSACQEWKTLEEDARVHIIPGFGKKLNNILSEYLSRYDAEAAFFEEAVRNSKRQILLKNGLQMAYPAYQLLLGHHRSKAFEKFKENLKSLCSEDSQFAAIVGRCTESCIAEFNEGSADAYVEVSDWDPTKTRDKLLRDIDAHVNAVQEEKLEQLVNKYENKLEKGIAEPVEALLDAATPDTWPTIKKLMIKQTETATNGLARDISGFQLDKKEEEKMLVNLRNAGRRMVEKKSREEANQVLLRMKERFTSVLSHGPDSLPRVWNGKEDIKAIIQDARISAVKLLSTLSALRLEGKKLDHIDHALTSLVQDETEAGSQNSTVTERGLTLTGPKALASNSWEGVAASDTLISPIQCRHLWKQFNRDIEYTITQAITAQEASRRSNSQLPPAWAMVAMVCLGFNEFMTLLKNPLYLVITFVLFLLGRAVWVQLDIEREFQNGYLTGTLAISTKLLPAFMNFLKRLAQEGERMASGSGYTNGSTVSSGRSPHNYVPEQELAFFGSSNEDLSTNGEEHTRAGQDLRKSHMAS